MKKKLFLVCLFIIISFLIKTTHAQEKGFGMGVMLGEPTGLSGKYWTSDENALNFGLGYSFTSHDSRVNLHVDYLFHLFDEIKAPEIFVIYYGAGVRIKTVENSDNTFGVRGVAGIDWFIHNAPIDVFFEMAPVFKLIPKTALDLDAGIGVRYFF